ncbi:hypothetical protein TKK_0013683 [Trichogramma kaykai]
MECDAYPTSKVVPEPGRFNNHCKNFDIQLQKVNELLRLIKERVCELNRDIAVKYQLNISILEKHYDAILRDCQTLDQQLDNQQIELERLRSIFNALWEEQLCRIHLEKEVFHSQYLSKPKQKPASVIFWNAADLRNAQDICEEVKQKYILCISETWRKDPTLLPANFDDLNFQCIFSPAIRTSSRGRAMGGLACYFNEELYKIEKLYITSAYITFRIRNLNIIIISIYVNIHLFDELLEDLSTHIGILESAFPSEELIISGDFNSRVALENNDLDSDMYSKKE